MPSATRLLRLAVLISGSGSTLRNILERCADGRLRGVQVVGVVASRNCSGLDHARLFGVPHTICDRTQGAEPFDLARFSQRVTDSLAPWQPDLIACAGFLSRYVAPEKWRERVINIHPALLPQHGGAGLYGDRVHRAVLSSGAKVSGCTVHLVTDEYDAGPIIAQRVVPVLEDDTSTSLGARVRQAEAELYPIVLQWFADGRVRIADGMVSVVGRELIRGDDVAKMG